MFPDLLKDILKLPYYPSDEYIDMLKSVHEAAWQLECNYRLEESKYLISFLEKDWEENKEEYNYVLETQKSKENLLSWDKPSLVDEIINLRRIVDRWT